MKLGIKDFLFFLFFFLLLYAEDRIFLGGISLSNLWKSVAVFFLFFYCVKLIVRHNAITSFSKLIFFLSLSLLIGPYKFFSLADIQEVAISILIFPISYYYLYYGYRNRIDKLYRILFLLAIFLIISSLPFILGLVQSVREYDDISNLYGLDGGALVGFYKHPANSSKIFVFSTLMLFTYVYQIGKNRLFKIIFIFSIILGIYCVYLSFTRTGWLMLIFGVVFLITYKRNLNAYIRVIPALLLVVLGLIYIFNTNDALRRRTLGERIGRENTQTGEWTDITSGRDVLVLKALKGVSEEGAVAVLFGVGKTKALKMNDNILAHNRFVEIYQYGGLLSLIIFLYYLYYTYQEFARRKSNSGAYRLCMVYYILLIVSLIPSHGLPIWADVLFGGIIAVNRIIYELNNSEQNMIVDA